MEKYHVTVNKELNPALWYDTGMDPKLDPAIAAKLMHIATAFYKFIDVDLNIIDCTITGSSANYTWNAHSDIDLHLVVSGIPSDDHRELFNAKKAVWAEQHDITIKGLPVEVYVQGDAEPHYSTGVYSVLNKKWIIKPKKVKPNIDDSSVNAKRDYYMEIIEKALAEEDLQKLNQIKERIVKMRKAGLERAGEWSTENLVFKVLRNTKMIDLITDKIHELEDKQFSMEHLHQ